MPLTSHLVLGRSSRLVAVPIAVLSLAACDIGDGTTLSEPTAETTLPPPDTTPLETLPLESPAIDALPAIEPVPIVTAAPASNGLPDDPSGDGVVNGFSAFAPWKDGAAIDILFTCDGADASPAISWSGVPDGAQELAISLVDESNLSNGRPFIHWVLAGIDPGVDRIGENELPPGAVRGLNFFGNVGYTGPCPNPGTAGTFSLTVFALNQQLEVADGTPAAELLDVIGTVSIGSATSFGTVTR